MKGLLHSKKFRKNLYHWLIMYTGVLLLLTSVITYSRYLTTLNGKDEARVAKFNIHIDDTNNCTKDTTAGLIKCAAGTYRPTSEIPILFTIETELEVTTELELNIYAKDGFKLKDLTEVTNTTNNDIIKKYYLDENKKYQLITEDTIDKEIAMIKLNKIISTTNQIQELQYQVIAQYTKDINQFTTSDNAYTAIEMSYTATQVTNK